MREKQHMIKSPIAEKFNFFIDKNLNFFSDLYFYCGLCIPNALIMRLN